LDFSGTNYLLTIRHVLRIKRVRLRRLMQLKVNNVDLWWEKRT